LSCPPIPRTYTKLSRASNSSSPSWETPFDVAGKLEEKKKLEEQMNRPDFWADPDAAQPIISQLKQLSAQVEPLVDLKRKAEDLAVLLDLAVEEDDAETLAECEDNLRKLTTRVEDLELRSLLSGKYDRNNAYVSFQAGAGGTESCDWASMLMRMYVRWAEKNGFDVSSIDIQSGEEAGIRRATILMSGPYAYGLLRPEIGVHRLVRISPFDANKRRHTSFAAVDVVPEIDDDIEVDIRDEDLRVDTYRASGAGGQHVNKTSSAVRITHIPTGIAVQCQNERSQHSNRRTAMKLLTARLYRLKEKEREAELAKLYGKKGEIAWGSQIRSYVMQPYTMVKDHRTSYETGNITAVLDGQIDNFIQEYLKTRVGKR